MRFSKRIILSSLILLALVGFVAAQDKGKATGDQDAAAQEQPKVGEPERMTVEELKAKITRAEPVLVIDSRSSGSYDSSDKKIKGSIRMAMDDYEVHLKDLPRDKEIVIYCS
jgi:hypothetical protein